MTRYIVMCDVCGKIGQNTIKKRMDEKCVKHIEATGHPAHVDRVKDSIWRGEN